MSLQKQLVHLNLSGGLERKDDSFLVIPSKLVVADDVEFADASTVVRRGGRSTISNSGLNGIAHHAVLNSGQMLLETRTASYRLNSSGVPNQVAAPTLVSGMSSPLVHRTAGMQTTRLSRMKPKGPQGSGEPTNDGNFDCAVAGNYTCTVFEDFNSAISRVNMRLLVRDESTGFTVFNTLISDVTNHLVKPRVVTDGTKFFIYAASFAPAAGTFDVKCMTATPTTYSTWTSVVTATVVGTVEDVTSPALFDVVVSSDNLRLGMVTLTNEATFTLTFQRLSLTDGYTVSSSITGAATAKPVQLTSLYSYDGTTYRLHAFYGLGANVVYGRSTEFTAVVAQTTLGTAAVGSLVGSIAACQASNTNIYLAWDSTGGTATTAWQSTLRISFFTHTYGALGECAGSAPWVVAGRIQTMQGRLYLPMQLVSTNYQSTVFIVDLTSVVQNVPSATALGPGYRVLARLDYGEIAVDTRSARWVRTRRIPNLSARGNTLVLPYLKYETNLRIAGTSNDTGVAVCQATIDFDSQLGFAEVNGTTVIAGACPTIFDGDTISEENFHHGPELDTTVALGAAGYELPNVAGSYSVCFTMGWTDARGNWHESAPSAVATFTVAANRFIPASAVVAPPTMKPGARIIFYRTKLLGTDTSLYLARTEFGTDITSDTDLDDGEQIYTAGGVLPNTPAPACRHINVFQKRLMLSGCGDGYDIHWSKQALPGYGVEFSYGDPTHQTRVPADHGRVVGTEEMDDRLVVLTERAAGLISGQGPASTGTSGQYSDFATISTETGCDWNSPRSIIRGPEGVWFRSPFGIRLISRSGQLARSQDGKQVGAEVDDLCSGNAFAVAGPSRQQIRFYQTGGSVLVWDYQWGRWTRFTNTGTVVDAVYADSRHYHIVNDFDDPGTTFLNTYILYHNDSAYQDVDPNGGTTVSFTGYVETPYLSFAGIQGFQRIYRLMLLGRNVDSSVQGQTFGIKFGFDFDQTSPPTAETVSAAVTPATGGLVQLQHHMARQKCEAIKVGISFQPTSTNTGRFRLTDLTLQVGVKPGYYKLPSGQRF